jgi:hypothetical protein
VLDDLRLGKQRVETMQVLRALVYPSYRGWKNHPATRMWRGFTAALVAYGLEVCAEWTRRGRADAVRAALLEFTGGVAPDVRVLRRSGALPPWLGWEPVHVSHRSALVRKDPEHYRGYFPDVPDDLPYVWPPAAFPRWPVRRGDRALSFEAALAELGWTQPLPGQREAVQQLLSGCDVRLDWSAGSGATSTGLLAALCLPGPTVWVSAHAVDTPEPAPPLAELRPAPRPVRASRVSASIARPPSPEDLAAVHLEQTAPRELHFHPAAALRRRSVRTALADASLVVSDRAGSVPRVGTAVLLQIAERL